MPPSPTIAAKQLQQAEKADVDVNANPPFDVQSAAVQTPINESLDQQQQQHVKSKEMVDPSSNTPRAPARLGRRYRPGQPAIRSTPKRGQISNENGPADPFDPDEFNQKYHGG